MPDCHADHIPSFTGAFRRNLDAMIGLLEGGRTDPRHKLIGFELERILVTPDGTAVPYSGERGVAALLSELASHRAPEERVYIDGHLLGLDYAIEVDGEPVRVTVSLEPASQLEVAVGPSASVRLLHRAVEEFDRGVERALDAIGLEASLCAQGYNPCVASPLELELIPKDRYRDMDAYLSLHGRYARDMMRCSASTQVSLDYEDEADAMRIYRMATLLGPVFAFLFDNAPTFRGAPTPGMARSRIWQHVDVDRCGIVPGSLGGLTFEDYVLWVSNVKPILFTDEQHVTTPTADRYARDIMSERELTRSELFHLLSMVFPNVRLKGFCELREMDSLPPRLAAACTSFTGALLYDRCLEAKLVAALADHMPAAFEGIDENDVVSARIHLEEQGWDAEPYGVPVTKLVNALVGIARENIQEGAGCTGVSSDAPADVTVPVVRGLEEDRIFDLEGVDMLANMWGRRMNPRCNASI